MRWFVCLVVLAVSAPAVAEPDPHAEMAAALAAQVTTHPAPAVLPVWTGVSRTAVAPAKAGLARATTVQGQRAANQAADQAAIDEKLAVARAAGARIEILDGENPVDALLDYAKSRGVTQIFIGHSMRKGWWERFRGNPVERLIDLAEGIDVRVFPQRTGS